jgi:hypothetical protein
VMILSAVRELPFVGMSILSQVFVID